MNEPYDAIVLSPHLDDAVLSCGAQIAHRTDRGGRILVVTVFAGDEPEPPHSPLAEKLHRLFGLEGAIVDQRRREDLSACEALGAEIEHWDLLEAIYRRDAEGEPLYTRLRELFTPARPADSDVVEAITDRIAGLPRARELLVPLGVGNHVDHGLVRRAVEVHDTNADSLDPRSYYEELPYAARWRAVGRALGRRREWVAERIEISPRDLERKIEACSLYSSQIAALFGTPRRMASRLRRYCRKVGGERVWRRLSQNATDSTPTGSDPG